MWPAPFLPNQLNVMAICILISIISVFRDDEIEFSRVNLFHIAHLNILCGQQRKTLSKLYVCAAKKDVIRGVEPIYRDAPGSRRALPLSPFPMASRPF